MEWLCDKIIDAFVKVIANNIFKGLFDKKSSQSEELNPQPEELDIEFTFRIHRRSHSQKTEYEQKSHVSPQSYEFRLGNRETSIVVIDGDGHKEFNSENIRVHIIESISPVWPKEVDRHYEETLSEIQQKKENGEIVPWNGSILSLRRYRISRTPNLEEYEIDLFLEESDYYRVYSTIHKLGNGADSLKEKYIDSYAFDNDSVYQLPNAIGICMLIKTKDGKAIFAVRSNSSGFRPGEDDVSIVEGVNPKLDFDGNPLVFDKIAKRAVQEEICDINESEANVSILGMVFDKEYNQWNIIGFIDLKLTQEEVIDRRSKGVSGKWELSFLKFIKFSPKDIMQYLSNHKMWDMGLITTYFSLVYNHYSAETIQEYAKMYLK